MKYTVQYTPKAVKELICEIQEQRVVILVVKIGHRREIYR